VAAILTDIEGTIGALDFVKGTLFPYARERLPNFVKVHAARHDVERWLNDLARRHQIANDDHDALIERLLELSDADIKDPALKALQGMIWADGYAERAFVAHLYPDVLPAFERWSAQGHALYVYSSGSLPAQLQYFRHTPHGDLSERISGFFDTHVGGKREPASYAEILRRIERPATEVLFLSDIVEELDAAKASGIATIRLVRDGTINASAHHQEVPSFEEIHWPTNAAKPA
jgi:enolase-phosphatase E1